MRQNKDRTRHSQVSIEIVEFPGESKPVKQLRDELRRAAQTTLPVLLVGETGTGKHLAATVIHKLSTRHDQLFLTVNLAAIPDNLMSSELVGYTKGAFTGADRDSPGLLERAGRGTLLLDEIGEASVQTQLLLLSVLESGALRRLGEVTVRKLDLRIIFATNRTCGRWRRQDSSAPIC